MHIDIDTCSLYYYAPSSDRKANTCFVRMGKEIPSKAGQRLDTTAITGTTAIQQPLIKQPQQSTRNPITLGVNNNKRKCGDPAFLSYVAVLGGVSVYTRSAQPSYTLLCPRNAGCNQKCTYCYTACLFSL
jgi:hypothetical protein